MTARSKKAADKPAVSVSMIVVAVAVLVLVLGGLAWHFFGSGAGGASTRPLTTREQSDQDWIQQKAKQTNGNFDKLSPEDQRRVIALYGPKAPFTFMMAARHQPASP